MHCRVREGGRCLTGLGRGICFGRVGGSGKVRLAINALLGKG